MSYLSEAKDALDHAKDALADAFQSGEITGDESDSLSGRIGRLADDIGYLDTSTKGIDHA